MMCIILVGFSLEIKSQADLNRPELRNLALKKVQIALVLSLGETSGLEISLACRINWAVLTLLQIL
jgi:hypothetical protein